MSTWFDMQMLMGCNGFWYGRVRYQRGQRGLSTDAPECTGFRARQAGKPIRTTVYSECLTQLLAGIRLLLISINSRVPDILSLQVVYQRRTNTDRY